MTKNISGDSSKKTGYMNGGYVFLIMLFVFFAVLALGMLFQYWMNINVGKVDKSFGNDGKIQMNFDSSSDRVHGIIEQMDGKFIVIGTSSISSNSSENSDVLIARYLEDGTLDFEFGDNGKKIIDLGGTDVGLAVNLQVDGKIITANRSCISDNNECSAILIRLNSDGTFDNTFGDDGVQTIQLDDLFYGAPHRFLINPNGDIILGGSVWNGTDFDFAVYKINNDGTKNTNFGVDGLTTFDFGTGKVDIATDLTFQGENIIVLGRTCDSVSENKCGIGLTRITSDGLIDTSFGNKGKMTTKLNTNIIPKTIAVQQNGNLLVVGDKKDLVNRFVLIRYKTNGKMDENFGKNGKIVDNFINDKDAWGDDVIVQPEGKIVLIGHTIREGNSSDFVLKRYESDGTQDIIFGDNGNLFIDFGQQDYDPVALQNVDGKFVVAGSTEDGTQVEVALTRVLP